MKKIINNPDAFVDEALEGIFLAHGGQLKAAGGDLRVLVRSEAPKAGKVAVVTGGGSGHLPTFLGYVGEGMLDACAVGNVFASPSAQTMYKCIKAVDGGSGVLCLFGNYGGDRMNFEMACELADLDGIRCERILAADDVASAPAAQADKRRGVAGLIFAYKIAGAAADRMLDLDGVCAATRKALDNIRSMGVATAPCILPQVGKPTFTIDEGQLEVGMGIHGEPGIEVRDMMTADETAELLAGKLLAELSLGAGDRAAVMVNGLGATPLEELYICYRRIHRLLSERGVALETPLVGEFATSMEMAGLSVSIMKLSDPQLLELYKHPASTPFFKVNP